MHTADTPTELTAPDLTSDLSLETSDAYGTSIKTFNFGTLQFRKADGTVVNELRNVLVSLIRGEEAPDISCKIQLRFQSVSYGQYSVNPFSFKLIAQSDNSGTWVDLTLTEFSISIGCDARNVSLEKAFPLQYFPLTRRMSKPRSQQLGASC